LANVVLYLFHLVSLNIVKAKNLATGQSGDSFRHKGSVLSRQAKPELKWP